MKNESSLKTLKSFLDCCNEKNSIEVYYYLKNNDLVLRIEKSNKYSLEGNILIGDEFGILFNRQFEKLYHKVVIEVNNEITTFTLTSNRGDYWMVVISYS